MSTQNMTWADRPEIESWVPVLREAAKEVLSIMAGVEAVDKAEAVTSSCSDITAMVGLAGALCGIISIRCSNDLANKIASRMLGLPAEEASEHCGDAMGEVCNMVAGHFKAKIPALEDKCLLSVPSVITGDNYTFQSFSAGQRVEVVLAADEDPLWIMLEARS